MGVAHADDPLLVGEDQRERTLEGADHGGHRVLQQVHLHLVGDQLGDQVAVAGHHALEHPGLLGQALGVHQVAVVAEGELVLADRAVGRLGVAPRRRARRRVAAVADGQVAVEAGERAVVEHAGHEALVLDHGERLAVADGHARRLLPAVLQREEAQVAELGDRQGRAVDGEDAARLLQLVGPAGRRRGGIRGGHADHSAATPPRVIASSVGQHDRWPCWRVPHGPAGAPTLSPRCCRCCVRRPR